MVFFQYNSPQRIKPLQKGNRERERERDLLFFATTQASWAWQQRSSPSHGFSPGQPLYRSPQYFPYLRNGGTAHHNHINQSDSFKILQPLQTPNRLSSGPYLGCATRANLSPPMEPWFAMFSFFHPNTSNDQQLQLAQEVNIKMWTIQK